VEHRKHLSLREKPDKGGYVAVGKELGVRKGRRKNREKGTSIASGEGEERTV